jgi:hypothetical protein
MAKNNSTSKYGGSSNAEYVPSESTKMGDIVTAARSTMDAGDYTHGYPPCPGALRTNNSYPTRKKG